MVSRRCLLAVVVALSNASCGGSGDSASTRPPEGTLEPASAAAPPPPAPSAPLPPAAPPVQSGESASAWAAVDAKAAEAFATGGFSGMTVAVFDRDDVKVFEKTYGDFSPTRRVAVASASKIVAGTVILRLVGQGLLSLESTTSQVLGWTGTRGAITMRQLLSFTSGLRPEAACVNNPFITLATCVDQVRDDPTALVAAPGSRFDYGNTHLHVAARMAEVATGKSWNTLYAEQLRIPLGLGSDSTFHTLPEQRIGTVNPRVAGGLIASLDEYARILAISFHRGTYRGVSYAPAALFDLQGVAPYPSATIGESPFAGSGLDFRYGLAAWLECGTPDTGCSTLSSPGAFGWTPWFDRQAGYYAVIAMQEPRVDGNDVVERSVGLAQSIKADIVRALASR